jgi:spore germination protein YaaH
MARMKEWIAEKGIQPVYDESSGQNYAEYFAAEENATYKVWIEDELSLTKRANLAANYQLAGMASWSRAFGDQAAWTAMNIDPNKAVTQK